MHPFDCQCPDCDPAGEPEASSEDQDYEVRCVQCHQIPTWNLEKVNGAWVCRDCIAEHAYETWKAHRKGEL